MGSSPILDIYNTYCETQSFAGLVEWQTRQTQNLMRGIPRMGSTPIPSIVLPYKIPFLGSHEFSYGSFFCQAKSKCMTLSYSALRPAF